MSCHDVSIRESVDEKDEPDPTLVTRDMLGTNSALLKLIPETTIVYRSILMHNTNNNPKMVRLIIQMMVLNEIITMTTTCFHQPRKE